MRKNSYLKGKSKQMMTGEFDDCEISMFEEIVTKEEGMKNAQLNSNCWNGRKW